MQVKKSLSLLFEGPRNEKDSFRRYFIGNCILGIALGAEIGAITLYGHKPNASDVGIVALYYVGDRVKNRVLEFVMPKVEYALNKILRHVPIEKRIE